MDEACCAESTSKKREVDASLFFDDCYAHADVRSFRAGKRLIFNLAALGILFQELHDTYGEVGANIIGP